MVMYSFCNSDTLEKLINTVCEMYNTTTWNEKIFPSKPDHWHLSKNGVGHYAINSLLYLTMLREKYAKMYETFISQLKMYANVIGVLSNGYLPFSLMPPS